MHSAVGTSQYLWNGVRHHGRGGLPRGVSGGLLEGRFGAAIAAGDRTVLNDTDGQSCCGEPGLDLFVGQAGCGCHFDHGDTVSGGCDRNRGRDAKVDFGGPQWRSIGPWN